MNVVYSRLANTTGLESPNYWQYFGSRLTEHARIPEGATVLDIGTGPGSVLIPTAKRAGIHGLGVGVDIDFGWFKHVFPELQKRNIRNTALVQMDTINLGFMNDKFDHVLCGFLGWSYCFDFFEMQFTGPDVRLAEITRVLRDRGRVSISSWERQEDLEWLGEHFQRHFPAYVANQREEAGTPLIVYSKENAEGLEWILRDGGYQDVEITTETAEFVSADEEEWWGQVWGGGWWEHLDQVARMDANKFRQFKEQVFENLQQQKHHDGIHFSKTVLYALGKKQA
jgi:ubiquinone/menaquinone biosynthesis C-methylase UbiE